MKLLFTIILFIPIQLFGQTTISRSVVGSSGTSVTTSLGNNYMYNVGEVAVTTTSSTSFILKQGFEQPDYVIGPILSTFNPPNVFTPDNDGVNDTWILPINIDLAQSNSVTIYNRWGDIIIKFDNYNNSDVAWDGSDKNGTPVTPGTFFYVIEFPTTGESYSGWVQVLR